MHHSKTCKAVSDLVADLIAKENSGAVVETERAQTLKEFWDATTADHWGHFPTAESMGRHFFS